MTGPLTNPVGFLQEFCQKYNAAAFPKYTEIGASGPDHCREFSCECSFDGRVVIGKSRQKKFAKYESAKSMYELLQKESYFDKYFVINNKSSDECDNTLSLNVTSNSVVAQHEPTKNPISALQELCQRNKVILPFYFESSTGSGFVCECTVLGKKTYGHGSSKKNAKSESAAKMCTELKIPFADESTSVNTEEFCSEKNAISALQELCSKTVSLPAPVYESKESFDNNFLVVCNVGTVSGEGNNSNKKCAKVLAANIVLGKLLQKGMTMNGTKTPEHKSNDKQDQKLTDYVSVLEEYNVCSDDVKPAVIPSLNHDTIDTLASLSLDDSLVEIEPLTFTVKEEVKDHSGCDDVDTNIRIKEELFPQSGHEVHYGCIISIQYRSGRHIESKIINRNNK